MMPSLCSTVFFSNETWKDWKASNKPTVQWKKPERWQSVLSSHTPQHLGFESPRIRGVSQIISPMPSTLLRSHDFISTSLHREFVCEISSHKLDFLQKDLQMCGSVLKCFKSLENQKDQLTCGNSYRSKFHLVFYQCSARKNLPNVRSSKRLEQLGSRICGNLG